MSGLSEQQLAEIQERVINATPGPWELYPDYGPNFYANVRGGMLLPVGSVEFGDGECADADRALVEHAAEDIAALLARIAELEAERHSTNEALSEAAEAIREKDARLAAVRDAVAEAFMCPDEDCDGHLPKLEQILGGLDLLRDAEAGGSRG